MLWFERLTLSDPNMVSDLIINPNVALGPLWTRFDPIWSLWDLILSDFVWTLDLPKLHDLVKEFFWFFPKPYAHLVDVRGYCFTMKPREDFPCEDPMLLSWRSTVVSRRTRRLPLWIPTVASANVIYTCGFRTVFLTLVRTHVDLESLRVLARTYSEIRADFAHLRGLSQRSAWALITRACFKSLIESFARIFSWPMRAWIFDLWESVDPHIFWPVRTFCLTLVDDIFILCISNFWSARIIIQTRVDIFLDPRGFILRLTRISI